MSKISFNSNETHPKYFDYIVFASAKDRRYDYYTGKINVVGENVDSFENLIRRVNKVVYNNDQNQDDTEKILKFDGKLLIIIDDYETFPNDEKTRIENFIRKLDINHHKVLITTRANLIIGDEFQTNELNREETKGFLLEVLKSEFPDYNIDRANKELDEENRYWSVYEITSGRPLFIFQFAFIWVQTGTLASALQRNIKQSSEAVNFLYGRIYDYLGEVSKDIFVVVSRLVTEDDLTNLVEKLKYLLNLENETDKFNRGLQELVKLKVIEVLEGDFFKVYSKEMLPIMADYFEKRSDSFKGGVTSRLKHVTKNKKLDNEHALLENANASRYSKSEEEVISLYRQILHRGSSPYSIKLQALLNLTDYLVNSRGKRDMAIKVFKDFDHLFSSDPVYAKTYATYCWADDQKEDAIRILYDLFARKNKFFDHNVNLWLDLLGLLLTYRCIYAIQQKEELKERDRFSEVSRSEFSKLNGQIKDMFLDIDKKHGTVLFNEVKRITDISDLKSGTRQNIEVGLYQFVNVCIRLNKFPLAREICEYVLDKFPTYLHNHFKAKLRFIDQIQVRKPNY